jgi:hypothetical protein
MHTDSTILAAIINADFNPRAAAQSLAVPLSTILTWSAIPDNRAKLDDALAASEFYLTALEIRAKARAIETLTSLNDSSTDPIERRRIATALLKCAPRARAAAKPKEPDPSEGVVFDYEGFMRSAERKRAVAAECATTVGGPAPTVVPHAGSSGGSDAAAGSANPSAPASNHQPANPLAGGNVAGLCGSIVGDGVP